jgi:hypothetical protein
MEDDIEIQKVKQEIQDLNSKYELEKITHRDKKIISLQNNLNQNNATKQESTPFLKQRVYDVSIGEEFPIIVTTF